MRISDWSSDVCSSDFSGMIFLIIIGAGLFNFFLEGTNVPQFLIQQVQRLDLGPTMFLVILTVFYIVLGCLMDDLAMILLTLPVVFPITQALGIDAIWFGIYIVTIVEKIGSASCRERVCQYV